MNFLFYERSPGLPMPPAASLKEKPVKTGHAPEYACWEFNVDDFTAGRGRLMMDVLDATDPDLTRFLVRENGKLILYHGWADPGPAPENTINYYEAVNRKLGGRQDDWMRLFLMPGVGHCGGGIGPDQADFLGALERWREGGVAPAQITATRGAGRGGANATPMSRPLCPFPQVARYKGSGSTNDAANFTCSAP